jgi:predicted transcriptional regulator
VLGVVTRRDLLAPAVDVQAPVSTLIRRPPIVVNPDHSLREAADLMVTADVGRLVVVESSAPHRMVGILTRGDLLSAHLRRLRATHQRSRQIDLRAFTRRLRSEDREED